MFEKNKIIIFIFLSLFLKKLNKDIKKSKKKYIYIQKKT